MSMDVNFRSVFISSYNNKNLEFIRQSYVRMYTFETENT